MLGGKKEKSMTVKVDTPCVTDLPTPPSAPLCYCGNIAKEKKFSKGSFRSKKVFLGEGNLK